MLEYYQTYLENIAQTPAEQFRENAQAQVNSEWENTHLLANVKEEIASGSNIFADIEVRKTTVSEYSVNMFKNATDNRRLTFKDCEHTIERGRKYMFNNNYWITYDETTEESLYAQISIRRCNNELKWIDKENGQIFTEPCCIGEESSATNPNINKDIQVVGGRTLLMVQGNSQTAKIKENQRFIISHLPYRLVAFNNYALSDKDDEQANLMWYYLQKDVIEPFDDVENNIADRYKYDYNIEINQDDFEQVNGYKGTLTANILLNKEIVDEEITWSSNEFATIDSQGDFTLKGDVGDIAIIKASIKNNVDVYDTIQIKIIDIIKDEFELIIAPLYTEIKQGETLNFDVDIYKNNIKQNADISYTVNDINPQCYALTKSSNTFTLKGYRMSNQPLEITFSNGNITKTISIILKSIF